MIMPNPEIITEKLSYQEITTEQLSYQQLRRYFLDVCAQLFDPNGRSHGDLNYICNSLRYLCEAGIYSDFFTQIQYDRECQKELRRVHGLLKGKRGEPDKWRQFVAKYVVQRPSQSRNTLRF
jgi:hypothetical protein